MSSQISNSLSSTVYEAPRSVDKTAGRWTSQEHKLFMIGLQEFGKDWKQIEQLVKTRSGSQIRSHAQKYFNKLSKSILKSHKGHEEDDTNLPVNQGIHTQIIDFDSIFIPSKSVFNSNQAYLEENFLHHLTDLSKSSYKQSEIPLNFLSHFNTSIHHKFSSLLNQNQKYFSFFENIFPDPKETLNINFFQNLVDYNSFEIFQNNLRDVKESENKKQKRSISFTPFCRNEVTASSDNTELDTKTLPNMC